MRCPLAGRERMHRPVEIDGEAEAFGAFAHCLAQRPARHRAIKRDGDVFQRSELLEQREVLEHHGRRPAPALPAAWAG